MFYNFRRAVENLAEIKTKLLIRKPQNKSVLSSVMTRPVLKPQGVGSLNHGLISHGNSVPREHLLTSVSTSRTSDESPEINLRKVGYVSSFPWVPDFLDNSRC